MTAVRQAHATRLRLRLGAVVGSVAASVLVWVIASLVGADLRVVSPVAGTMTIDAALVIATSLPLAVAAWGVLVLVERRSARPRTVWTVVSVSVLALSLPPLAFLEATIATKGVLALMHLATGLVLVLAFRRSIE